jgi:hypothetical protein
MFKYKSHKIGRILKFRSWDELRVLALLTTSEGPYQLHNSAEETERSCIVHGKHQRSVCKDFGIVHFPAPLFVLHLIFIPVLELLAIVKTRVENLTGLGPGGFGPPACRATMI